MKFKIRGQGEKEEVVEFWLELDGGKVVLRARKDDIDWNICEILGEGLYRYRSVSDNLGFPVDDDGRIKLDE